MRGYLLLIVLMLLVVPMAQAQNEAKIDAILQNPFLKADFKKERQLKVLSKPFITYGFMLFKPDKGLIWKTTRPLVDTILIKADEVRQLDNDGSANPMPMNNPIMGTAAETFLTIMSRDKQKILSVFDYTSETDSKGNTIYNLVPKHEQVRALISNIKLSGQDRIEIIEILERSGDSTRINLSNELFDKSALTTQEQALFERI